VVATVLAARGITTRTAADRFYKPQLEAAHDPLLLPGMAEAVARTRKAIANGELICLYGDFDVDGVTSVAALTLGLRGLGAKTTPYIPDRFAEGYGLNFEAVRTVRVRGASLLVTADCGISSVAEVRLANELGLDVIILDHHTVPEEMPPALAAVNPKRLDSPYPFNELAAVGVAYRFLQVLYEAEHRQLEESELIDLVALGTVVDVAPLADENRQIVRAGLGRMQGGLRPGLQALATVSGTRAERFNAETLGFAIGPRLNAAGRLKHADLALALMLAEDPLTAAPLAAELDALNRQRQQDTIDALAAAEALCDPTAPLIMVGSAGVSAGIVGLVAARLVERWARPAIVYEQGPEVSRASCRSIPPFDIVSAVRKEKHLLVRHGGHRAAAGFTVANEHLDELRERLTNTAAELLDEDDLKKTLTIDCETPLAEVGGVDIRGLMQFEPCGHGNPKPVLLSRGVKVLRSKLVGGEGEHVSLMVKDGNLTWPAIAFRQGDVEIPAEADIVYSFSREWGGDQLKLEIYDFAPSGVGRPLV
jgi:single-stranded-DNA-specific exonuclease